MCAGDGRVYEREALLGFWLRNHASGANDDDYAVNAYVQRVHDFVLTDCYMITRATAQALLP